MKLINYVENIKSTNFILGTNTKSMNLRIHELVIFNQTTKIDAHEEKDFHSILKQKSNIYNYVAISYELLFTRVIKKKKKQKNPENHIKFSANDTFLEHLQAQIQNI